MNQYENIIQIRQDYLSYFSDKKYEKLLIGLTRCVCVLLAVPSLFSELVGHLSSNTSPSTVADLQFLANSLSETLSEKDTALQHLRSANK